VLFQTKNTAPTTRRFAIPLLLLAIAPLLTGCFKHTRLVQKTRRPDVVLDATPDQLVSKLNSNFAALQTLNASVTVTASTGGGSAGKITEYTSFKGFILMRKPRDLRVILQVPVLGSAAFEMASVDQNFKLVIPPYNKAMTGTDHSPETPNKNALYNLRPYIFFDAFFVQGVSSGEFVAVTQSERVLMPDPRKRDAIAEPDYDLSILHTKVGELSGANLLETLRVVHYSRVTLLPYQQDIYDTSGRIVTSVLYDGYQKFGDLNFPTRIDIKRPYDELELKIVITKLTANKPLDDDSFQLEIPAGYTLQKMN